MATRSSVKHRPRPPVPNEQSRKMAPPSLRVLSRDRALLPASLRQDMIREAAYFRAEARGFAPGGEIDDWLSAEADIEELILRRYGY
jgi:hypothetical protein